jgi:hypothetical protein
VQARPIDPAARFFYANRINEVAAKRFWFTIFAFSRFGLNFTDWNLPPSPFGDAKS